METPQRRGEVKDPPPPPSDMDQKRTSSQRKREMVDILSVPRVNRRDRLHYLAGIRQFYIHIQ